MKVTLCSNERIKEILSTQSCSSLGPPQNNERINCTVFQCLINLLNFLHVNSFTNWDWSLYWVTTLQMSLQACRTKVFVFIQTHLIILDILVSQFNFWISTISLAVMLCKFSFFGMFNSNCAWSWSITYLPLLTGTKFYILCALPITKQNKQKGC